MMLGMIRGRSWAWSLGLGGGSSRPGALKDLGVARAQGLGPRIVMQTTPWTAKIDFDTARFLLIRQLTATIEKYILFCSIFGPHRHPSGSPPSLCSNLRLLA
jgi:hypothetical protein